MSILVVYLVPQGILFCADRNFTTSWPDPPTSGPVYIGQSQRPKVLQWPNQEAIIGYVGAGSINGEPTDQWLYRSVIGRHLTIGGFESVARSLTSDLDEAMRAGRLSGELIIHLGGFEKIRDEWTPVIWFIHNTAGLEPPLGTYILAPGFSCSEEMSGKYFTGKTGTQIRVEVAVPANTGRPFSFRQGVDLAAFGVLDTGICMALASLVAGHHPSHPSLQSLGEWTKHIRMTVLAYGAYFEAFHPSFSRLVGGGADVVWAEWPSL